LLRRGDVHLQVPPGAPPKRPVGAMFSAIQQEAVFEAANFFPRGLVPVAFRLAGKKRFRVGLDDCRPLSATDWHFRLTRGQVSLIEEQRRVSAGRNADRVMAGEKALMSHRA